MPLGFLFALLVGRALACGDLIQGARHFASILSSNSTAPQEVHRMTIAADREKSTHSDLIAAKLFLRLALSGGGPRPRVINVDGLPAYACAIAELNQTGELGRRCRR